MIKRLELNGFKSFVSDTLELGQLTLLTGLNSSGKSSVIQALLLLEKASKAAENERLFLDGHGDIMESQNRYSRGVGIEGTFAQDKVIAIENGYVIKKDEIKFPELIYIAADRFGPETSVPINVGSYKLGKRGENIFRVINEYADYELPKKMMHKDSEGDILLFNLRAWLGVISPNVKFKYELQEMSDSSFSSFNGHRAKNVGFGLSYALPVITALLLGSIKPNSLVMIENPEAHLHPRGQTEMARLISLCAEVGTQVIIETHSDHLFDGVRIFAKSNELDFYKKVKIYWFELDKNANTEVNEAVLDQNGRIDAWPAGMFDQFEINSSKLL